MKSGNIELSINLVKIGDVDGREYFLDTDTGQYYVGIGDHATPFCSLPIENCAKEEILYKGEVVKKIL